METVILPNPPSTWDELTEEQLIYIHTLLKEDLPESVYKMRVFLSLCGLELCGKSFFTHEDQLSVKDNLSVEECCQYHTLQFRQQQRPRLRWFSEHKFSLYRIPSL